RVLQHLEQFWAEPRQYDELNGLNRQKALAAEPHVGPAPANANDNGPEEITSALRVATCIDPEAEVTLAAREILRHARRGGRYRQVAVLVRRLQDYHHAFQRVFARYEIPFFLDRREPVSHHPLAELTRSALRTVAFQWRGEDWFAALKTGLVPAEDKEIDELETEALARGWKGSAWHAPLQLALEAGAPTEREQEWQQRLERLRQRIVA